MPVSLGALAGLAYALAWIGFALRDGARGARTSAVVHGLTAALVAYPLVGEAATRMGAFTPVAAAARPRRRDGRARRRGAAGGPLRLRLDGRPRGSGDRRRALRGHRRHRRLRVVPPRPLRRVPRAAARAGRRGSGVAAGRRGRPVPRARRVAFDAPRRDAGPLDRADARRDRGPRGSPRRARAARRRARREDARPRADRRPSARGGADRRGRTSLRRGRRLRSVGAPRDRARRARAPGSTRLDGLARRRRSSPAPRCSRDSCGRNLRRSSRRRARCRLPPGPPSSWRSRPRRLSSSRRRARPTRRPPGRGRCSRARPSPRECARARGRSRPVHVHGSGPGARAHGRAVRRRARGGVDRAVRALRGRLALSLPAPRGGGRQAPRRGPPCRRARDAHRGVRRSTA